MNDLTFLILKIVISIAVSLFTWYLLPLIKQKLEDRKNDQIIAMIETAVRAAEQTIVGSGQGIVKKEEVLKWVHDWLEKNGLDISEDQLDLLIEEAVFLMKRS